MKMSRGELDDATLAIISRQLPSIEELHKAVSRFSVDIISMRFGAGSTMPDAAVCLQDAVNTLHEAWFALHEALAHKIWYLEKAKQKDEFAATFFTRFYADDVALRLYSAAEHLANAIISMLEIKEKDLTPYKKGMISRQAIVGCYLRDEKPAHPIAVATSALDTSDAWNNTRDYRNTWVHKQPPPIRGCGIVYKRDKQRWQVSDDGKHRELHFGGGDEPEYSVEDLLKSIQPALSLFVKTCNDVVQFYLEILKAAK